MHLLGGGQLHAGQGQQAPAPAGPEEGRAVARGVVVGEGHNVQPGQGAHGGQIGGGHVLVGAGRQAGVEMKVVIQPHGARPVSREGGRPARRPEETRPRRCQGG
ncbi:hypothetical protein SDC9_165533 [bioreactor metagenome]|uniref:Uncharacterized protein n=1 Tax=bioreactor metagenome TaxID=1076179 RepID=A0A645FUN2_9ZZZZ